MITCGCPIEYKEKGKSNPRNRKIKQKKEFLNKFLASENIKSEFRKTEEKARIKQQRLKIKQEKQARVEEIKKKREAREKKLFGVTLD